jgi:hypothetical protein
LRLFFGDRPVLDAPRNHDELSLLDTNLPIPKLHPESSLHDEKQIVLLIVVVVVVPDELAEELDQLDVLPVQLARDLRLPALVERRELLCSMFTFSTLTLPPRILCRYYKKRSRS